MNEELINRITDILLPYFEQKDQAYLVACKIAEEIDPTAPTWYIHG